jgi:hypothetical protein
MSTIDYLGFVVAGEETRPLFRASEDEPPDRARVHVEDRRRGDDRRIVTHAKDMRTLEELLEAHEVTYTVLQLPPPLTDDDLALMDAVADWRARLRAGIARTVEQTAIGGVVAEDLSFIPALGADELDEFLAQSDEFLADPATTETDWNALVKEQERRIAASDPPVIAASEEPDAIEEERPPLLTIDDLTLRYDRGAIGGPRPLVDRG